MKVSLTDICDFQGGTQPPKDEWINQPAQGYVRMLQIRDFTQSDKNYIEYVKDTGKLKTCIEDDILIGRYGASIGKILTGLAGAYNVAIVKPIPDEKVVSKKYLYWYLNSQYFQRFISNVGSRAAQAGFNKNDLGAAQIPLVDKERQEEICEVLEKANKLISLRKQQLAKLDELVKARFVEMFGDPQSNSKGWPLDTLNNIISTIESGWSGNGKQREKTPDEIAVLKVSSVTKGYFIPTECKVLDDQSNIKKYVFPQKGDILFSRANTKEMVGATALITQDYPDLILPDKLWKIRFAENINVFYMKSILSSKSIRDRFSAESTGTSGSMYNVSMEKFRAITVPIPPFSLQNEFAVFVECVDQQKQTVQQSLEKLELMKKALMQEYFG